MSKVNTKVDFLLKKLLSDKVKRKRNITENLRVRAGRISSGNYSEVMVKITGFGKGSGNLEAHIKYLGRNKDEFEDDKGFTFTEKKEKDKLVEEWSKDFKEGIRKNSNRRDNIHLVLSMPPGTDPDAVKNATREFLKEKFSANHEYVFVQHTDQEHPHTHTVIKTLGFDGRRLNPRKNDLQEWREIFAEKLRGQGVDAEATPALIRGKIGDKSKSVAVIKHIEAGDNTHLPRVSTKKKDIERELLNEINKEQNGIRTKKPWEDTILNSQKQVRLDWLEIAEELKKESIAESDKLSRQIQQFVKDMPSIETKNQKIKKALLLSIQNEEEMEI